MGCETGDRQNNYFVLPNADSALPALKRFEILPACDTRQVARLSVLEVTSEHKRPLNGDALGLFD